MEKNKSKSVRVGPRNVPEAFRQDVIKHRIGVTIIGELIVGINRLYIIGAKPLFINLFKIYSLCLAFGCVYVTVAYDLYSSTSYYIVKYIICIEYLTLVVSAAFFQQRKFENVLFTLFKIDCDLAVANNKYFLSAATRGLLFTIFLVLLNVLEFIWCRFIFGDTWNYDIYVIYIANTAHDLEHLLFRYVMRSIFLRLQLIKSHVKKLLKDDQLNIIFDRDGPPDTLAKNVNIDISSLHRIYDELHTYSQELNHVMGLPMIVMLCTAAYCTIFFARVIYHMLLLPPTDMIYIEIGYHFIRCVRYTLTVLIPCAVAHSSSQAVVEIRAMLQDVSLFCQVDPVDQQKLEAFVHLTSEKPFKYSLWGLVGLDMQLPLSYCGACTTYLVLFIQMDKFID